MLSRSRRATVLALADVFLINLHMFRLLLIVQYAEKNRCPRQMRRTVQNLPYFLAYSQP